MAATAHDKVSSAWIAKSDSQAKLTLSQMQRYVRRALLDHDWVWFARDVAARHGVDTRSPIAVANFVRDFVARVVHFSPDPVGIENITPPAEHLEALQDALDVGGSGFIIGDCDDAATLSAALAGAFGVPARFTIRAFDWGRGPSPFQHVFTTLLPRGGAPVDVDTTRDAQHFPPKIQREFSIMV
jgi:transglutaminase-like putative cysteine protease